jgi:type I restriction enzyme M protein
MFGAIYGDIVGSVYEFNNIRTKNFELFSEKSKFTDDTVMTLAVANALVKFDKVMNIDDIFTASKPNKWEDSKAPWRAHLNLFKTLLTSEKHTLGDKYPHVGYGGRFRFWLREKLTEPYGSYGNGSAMRVSPVAWYANSLEETLDFAKASAEVTHNHPEGIKGAVVTAGATYLARTGATLDEIKAFVAKYYTIDFTFDEIRPTYEFNETCHDTVPQAMQAFFESTSFEDAIRNAISIGGDSDTLAAITGAVAEAYYGMTEREVRNVTTILDRTLLKILEDFRKRFVN